MSIEILNNKLNTIIDIKTAIAEAFESVENETSDFTAEEVKNILRGLIDKSREIEKLHDPKGTFVRNIYK